MYATLSSLPALLARPADGHSSRLDSGRPHERRRAALGSSQTSDLGYGSGSLRDIGPGVAGPYAGSVRFTAFTPVDVAALRVHRVVGVGRGRPSRCCP